MREGGGAVHVPMSPLTRVDALVAAVILANHPRRQPTWAGIADRLTAWAHEQPQTEHEEGEMPSQDRETRSADGTLEARNVAAPGVQKHPRDLTASTSTDVSGRHEQL